MGGREAIRGFAIQTLACLLDSLELSNDPWRVVTIEPDSLNDKVDIRWSLASGKIRAQQVKSSKNQIGRGSVVAWCDDLKKSGPADSYQLILAGPIAAAVLEDAPFNGVDVPPPTSLDTIALTDQAITKLDRYLANRAIDRLPISIRETLVHLVTAKLFEGSITGRDVSREEFDGWLLTWITSAYPRAIEQKLSVNCAVLWGSVEIAGPPKLGSRAFELVLPLSVVNGGMFVATVEWFFLRVVAPGREMRYQPLSTLPESGGISLRRENAMPFSPFAVGPQQSVSRCLLFVPVDKPGLATDEWPTESHSVSLYAKFADRDAPQLVKTVSMAISGDHGSVLGSGQSKHISVSDLSNYLDSM